MHLLFNLLFLAALLPAGVAQAVDSFREKFCDIYSESPHCSTGILPNCTMCHESSSGGKNNPFGLCLKEKNPYADLGAALSAVAGQDCDGDGRLNLDEIIAGTFPGVKEQVTPSPNVSDCELRNAQTPWNVCAYDFNFAYRRMLRDFCGRSPTMAEVSAFESLPDDSAKGDKLHAELDLCLSTKYWRGVDGALWQLAYPKVSPTQTIKSGVKAPLGEMPTARNGGDIALADYDDDFNLYTYYNIDNHDLRGILLSQDFVVRDDATSPPVYKTAENVPAAPENLGLLSVANALLPGDYQQFVSKEHRAGMLTTAWGFALREMFTSLPRGLAAHSLKSYLGWDIAREHLPRFSNQQGYKDFLSQNFDDWDNKGVLQQTSQSNCRSCHEALDPITYAFAKYNGFSLAIDSVKFSAYFDSLTLAQQLDVYKAFLNAEALQLLTDLQSGNASSTELLAVFGDIIALLPEQFRLDLINKDIFLLTYGFSENRIPMLAPSMAASEPRLAELPTKGFFVDRTINDLADFAAIAVDQPEFYQKFVRDMWMRVMRKVPESSPDTTRDFESLWKSLYVTLADVPFESQSPKMPTTNKLLHNLIATDSYGRP